MNNTVICYYSNIENNSFSDESFALIELWKENWLEKGWNPVVLDEDYARANKIIESVNFEDFGSNLYRFSINGPQYLIQCYYKWLAYTRFIIENGVTLWCDYDVYNHSLDFTKHQQKFGRPSLYCGSGAVGLMNEELSKKWLFYLQEFYNYNAEDTTNEKFQKILARGEVNDMMILKSFLASEDSFSRCPLCFNFDVDPEKVKGIDVVFDIDFIRTGWSLFHIHGGLTYDNNKLDVQSIDIPENCTTRLSRLEYVKSILNNK